MEKLQNYYLSFIKYNMTALNQIILLSVLNTSIAISKAITFFLLQWEFLCKIIILVKLNNNKLKPPNNMVSYHGNSKRVS